MAGLARSLLYAVGPADPVAYAAAALVLLIVAAAAGAGPARRATRIDPGDTLRADG